MKRLISLSLVLFLVLSCVLPVKAQAEGVEWIELLEHTTFNGIYNDFNYTDTRTFNVSLPRYMRVTKVDMLISHTLDTTPSKVEVYDGSTWHSLEIGKITNGVTRVFGDIGNALLDHLEVKFTKSGTRESSVDVKSFRIYTVPFSSRSLHGSFRLATPDTNYSMSLDQRLSVSGNNVNGAGKYTLSGSYTYGYLYDYLNFGFFIDGASITSITATSGDVTIPFEVSVIDTEAGSYWHGPTDDITFSRYGHYYVNLRLDISQLDRAAKQACEVLVTGYYLQWQGFVAQIYNFSGEVLVADTSEVDNWVRFKDFMSSQFTALSDGLADHFSNLSTWIDTMTGILRYPLVGIWTELEEGFANLNDWISTQTEVIMRGLSDIWDEIDLGFDNVRRWFEQYFGVKDQDAIDDLGDNSVSISQGASDIQDFEQSQQDVLNSGFASIKSAVTFTNFATALVFVQKYANMTINSIFDYTIVFTLPLFLGLFFYLCSRIPGVTKWKSRPPKSKGGGSS